MVLGLNGCFVSQDEHKAVEARLSAMKDELEAQKKEIKQLANALGDFQYQAIDPEISFSFNNVEISPPDSNYGSVTVKYSADLKQNNSDFVPNHYSVYVDVAILDDSGNEVSDFSFNAEIVNGVDAIANIDKAYSLKARDTSGFKIKVKQYDWYPLQRFPPYEK
tara:strand:- start:123 stop:614 length:492 start_codon:yes stop_codon:yes gene_type:complete